jgi:hypothetical protein
MGDYVAKLERTGNMHIPSFFFFLFFFGAARAPTKEDT